MIKTKKSCYAESGIIIEDVSIMKRTTILLLLCMFSCKPRSSAPAQDTTAATVPAVAPAPAAGPAPPPNPVTDTVNGYTIVPGKAIGNTLINENMEEVYKLLGKPDEGDAAMQKAVAIYYRDHQPGNYATSILSERDTGEHPVAKVKQIRITSPAFKTVEGLRVGSSFEEINKAHKLKKVNTYTEKGTTYTVWDGGKGIAFETDAAKNCIAITVYPAGETYKEAYLNIRPSKSR